MKLFKLILILSIFLISKSSFASHAMGAEITYSCLGQNWDGSWNYQVRYTLYRDCAGISAPPTIDIQYSSSCFYGSHQAILNPLPSSPTLITIVCPSDSTTCDYPASVNMGIQEWVYEGIVILQGACSDWILYHLESARNAAITTIIVSPQFVYTRINNTNNICNNSPVFNNAPVPITCLGQVYIFNHGVFDAEGDSLSFQLITPRTGPLSSDTVVYNAGYSKTQPLTSSPPMSFDESTGELIFVPQANEVTVMAVLVNEWRNGDLIGQVERDMQIIVMSCNNYLPVMTGINSIVGPTAYNTNVCVNDSNCFFLSSLDQDIAQTTKITWDNAIPGAVVTMSGGQRDSLFFCWTPTIADTSRIPYCFTVTVTDDNCPYVGIQDFTYCLSVSNDANCIPLVNSMSEYISYNDILKIYPQPANNYFIALIPEDRLNKNELILQNTLGEIIGRYSVKETSNKIELPFSLKGGCYFISLLGNSAGIISRRTLIVNR